MIEAIKSASKIPIEFKNKSEDSNLANGAKGYYSPTTDQIVVNKDLEDIHTAKTLIHEYAHSILHKQTDKDQSQREIEAESLAFVICDHFGLDTSEYSFGYIASYANNDPKELKEILNNIQSTAHEMIEQLEPIYKEKSIMLTKEDIEHENYKLFENIARHILTGDAIYMKYSTPHFMDLNIEMFDENRYVMAHNYVLNGDLMADPDVEFIVDKDDFSTNGRKSVAKIFQGIIITWLAPINKGFLTTPKPNTTIQTRLYYFPNDRKYALFSPYLQVQFHQNWPFSYAS